MDKRVGILAFVFALMLMLVAGTWPVWGGPLFNASCGTIFFLIGCYAFLHPEQTRQFMEQRQPSRAAKESLKHPVNAVWIWLMSVGFMIGGVLVVARAIATISAIG